LVVELSEAARLLAKSRKPRPVTCPICGTRFEAIGRRKYCSKKCANRAWWERYYAKHREERLAWQREYYRRKRARTLGAGESQPAD
jgi:tRNA(Ile2) C34 agmatinyltransferase TiaS